MGLPEPYLQALLDAEQLHDGARFICRYHHPGLGNAVPCEACIAAMMTLNEGLSDVEHDRPAMLAEVIAVRERIAKRGG